MSNMFPSISRDRLRRYHRPVTKPGAEPIVIRAVDRTGRTKPAYVASPLLDRTADQLGVGMKRYESVDEQRRREKRVWNTIGWMAALAFLIWWLIAVSNAAYAEELTVYSWGEFYPKGSDHSRLDFSRSRFPMPTAAVNSSINAAAEKCYGRDINDVLFAADYINDINPKLDSIGLAEQIVSGWFRATVEYDADVDLELLLAVYRYESRFNPQARNPSSGAYGLPQLLPRFHKQRLVEGMGLDWDSAEDQTYYSVWHMSVDMHKGQSLRRAASWWTVVSDGRAWTEYLRLKAERDG